MKNPLAQKAATESSIKPLSTNKPPAMFQKLHDDIEKLFDDFASGLGTWRNVLGEQFVACQPKLDVRDTGNEIIVTADLPGVEMDDLDITATPHYVSISGEKRSEHAERNNDFYRLEREYGFFRRVLPMPCEIEKDNVDAVLRNGVLTVTLPKTKAALQQESKVTVKAG